MPFLSKSEVGRRKSDVPAPAWIVGIASLVLLIFSLPAGAVERSVSDVVLVDTGAVIADDLYAAGNRVVIAGRVEGDLLVAAYEDVTITGTVTGDVTGVAGSVVVTGTVGESLRVATPTIEMTGEVGGDILAVAWEATVAGDVGEGATLWAWGAEVAGTLEGDLEGQTRRLDLAGTVAQNVDVTTNRLVVAEGTVVGGDLGYRSGAVAEGIDGAEVAGTVIHRSPLPANIRVRAVLILAKVVLGLMAAVVGLLVMWALPSASRRATSAVEASWWKAWLRGLGVLALPVGVVALGAMLVGLAPTEAALPLIGVLLPLFIAVAGLTMALAFAAPASVFPWIGRVGNRSRGAVTAFLLAAGAVIVLSLIPWATWLILLGLVPIGIGGWLFPMSGGPKTVPTQ